MLLLLLLLLQLLLLMLQLLLLLQGRGGSLLPGRSRPQRRATENAGAVHLRRRRHAAVLCRHHPRLSLPRRVPLCRGHAGYHPLSGGDHGGRRRTLRRDHADCTLGRNHADCTLGRDHIWLLLVGELLHGRCHLRSPQRIPLHGHGRISMTMH